MEVTVLIQHVRLELIRLGFNQLFEVCIVSNRNEGLQVKLKGQRWCKTNVGASREVKRATY